MIGDKPPPAPTPTLYAAIQNTHYHYTNYLIFMASLTSARIYRRRFSACATCRAETTGRSDPAPAQRQQQTGLAGRKAHAGEPVEILSGQVGDQAALELATGHLARNQQLQVFVIYLDSLPFLIRLFAYLNTIRASPISSFAGSDLKCNA